MIQAVDDTEAHPQFVYQMGDRTIRRREVDGVIVEVSSFPRDGRETLRAAFPSNGDDVFENRNGQRVRLPLDRMALREYDWRPDDESR